MGDRESARLCREVELPPSWPLVERTRNMVDEYLSAIDAELRQAAVMVASELAENVINHGELLPGEAWGRVVVRLSVDTIEIESVSGAREERAREVLEHIATIHGEDPEQLYLERLREMLAHPEMGGSRLGLYRIAYEGGFELGARFEDGVMTITASRRLPEEEEG